MWQMAAVYAGSTLYNMYSQKQMSKDEAEIQRQKALLKRQEATELLRRSEINLKSLTQEAESFREKQRGSYAKAGISGSENMTMAVLEESFSKYRTEYNRQRDEALYKADMLIAGADIDTRLAGDIEKAGKYKAAGAFLSGAAKTVGAYYEK